MTQIQISPDGGKTYGPDLVDRWKARAFAQDPGSETPCCGYEEEDTNWGGSSIAARRERRPGARDPRDVGRRLRHQRHPPRDLLPRRDAPEAPGCASTSSRRSTASTPSGTSTPARVTTFFNSRTPEGVTIDGRNDEVFGNLDDPCNAAATTTTTPATSTRATARSTSALQFCRVPLPPVVDMADPTFADGNVALQWSQTSGPARHDRRPHPDRQCSTRRLTPGGAAQSIAAVPYYRDDSCFDDGTGLRPGARAAPAQPGERASTRARRRRRAQCWRRTTASPGGDPRFCQGSIGTHGLHLLFLADSDNARQTVPLDRDRQPTGTWSCCRATRADVGEQYGRGFEKPLVAGS